ncbi:MAG: DUF1385 domain-containing protein [Proteobacteria bacterium]|nr:DUF1385 domain-containing protein [Pseudomonadota bacterium]
MTEGAAKYIGGQAVIEGVMMRSSCGLSVAVRRPNGDIAVSDKPLVDRWESSRLWRLPGFRGVAALISSVSDGFSALRFSAEQQLDEAERKQEAQASTKGAFVVSTLIALLVFIALPQLMTAGAASFMGTELAVQDWRFHLITGGFKLLLLAGYLCLIGQIPDVRRVFQYHGAEHKTIYAYEQGFELTVDNVQRQSKLHPRCGTTFLIVVIVISIVLGSLATPLLLPGAQGVSGQLLTLALRLALLPIVAGMSYELQRWLARQPDSGLLGVLLWPGYAFQLITTREPDDTQVEIAIAAMQTAIWRETVGREVPEGEPLVFRGFEAFNKALPSLRPLAAAA